MTSTSFAGACRDLFLGDREEIRNFLQFAVGVHRGEGPNQSGAMAITKAIFYSVIFL